MGVFYMPEKKETEAGQEANKPAGDTSPTGEAQVAKPEAETGAETEELGKPGLEALRKERETAAQLAADLKEAQKKIDAFEASKLTEEEKRQKAFDDLQSEADANAKRADEEARERMILEVVLAKELPIALKARLAGSTKEELEADADELLKLFPAEGGKRRPAPVEQLGNSGTKPVTPEEKMAAAFQQAFNGN